MVREYWKPITGFACYEISTLGRVRALSRLVKHPKGGLMHKQGQFLKPFGDRYLRVNLCHNSKALECSVHRLVAQAFIPNPENKPQVNHIKQPKTNNAVTNLEWTTEPENTAHAVATGLKAKGEAHGSAKLTTKKVIILRSLSKQGWSQRKIAKKFGVSQASVSKIVRGINWRIIA